MRPGRAVFAWALTLLAAILLRLRMAGIGLLGWDTYPLILTNRAENVGDLVALFGARLMQGLYSSEFYRPLVGLSFALDHALWGLRPAGYLWTSAILFAVCAAALWRLLRRLAGPGAWIAPLAGLLFFLLHPTQVEILAVPSRRAEMLSGLFMALALASQLEPRRLASRAIPWRPAGFALLAFLSKETTFTLPAVAFVAVFLASPLPHSSARARQAARALIPHAVALAAVLLARVAILGGIGGHATSGVGGSLARLPSYLGTMFKWSLLPQEALSGSALAASLLAAIAAAWLATLLLPGGERTGESERPAKSERQPAGDRGRRPQAPAPASLRMGLGGLAWLLAVGLAYAIAGEMSPWYMFLPVAGMAIVYGAFAGALARAVRLARPPARWAAALGAALLATLLVWQAAYSPAFYPYREWTEGTRVAGEFLEQATAVLAQAQPGTAVEGPPLPTWVHPRPEEASRPHVYGAAVFAEYTIQAWARLAYPERRIRVEIARDMNQAVASPDEVLLVLTRRLPGY